MLAIPEKNAKLTDGQTHGQTENDDFFNCYLAAHSQLQAILKETASLTQC